MGPLKDALVGSPNQPGDGRSTVHDKQPYLLLAVNDRTVTLTREHRQESRALTRSPHVPVRWGGKIALNAMLDTGADFSLVSASRLRHDTLQQLIPVTTGTCRGVDSKQVEIAGELWRDIEIGGTLVTQHRFLVVKGLVVPLILGADFLARLGEVTFDFQQGKLLAKNTGVRVDMIQHYTGETIELATVHARLACDVVIPGLCEQFVLCYADGLRAKHDYLLEPLRPDDDMVKPAHAVVVPDRDGEIWVRVANMHHGQETLRRGEYLATLYPDVEVTQSGRHARKPVTGYAVGPDITTEQRGEMEALITEYSDVMWQQGDTLPVVSVQVEHAIRLKPGAQPSSCRPRRLSQTEEEEVRVELDDLLRQGLIEPSSSPWSAAIVCARRKGGRLRLAIDYRALNAKSIPCSQHPIPRIDDLLDRLGEATFFTTLDLKSGYHQMPVRKEDRELTSFVVPCMGSIPMASPLSLWTVGSAIQLPTPRVGGIR